MTNFWLLILNNFWITFFNPIKAYLFNGCLSGSSSSQRSDFLHAGMVGGLSDIHVPQIIEYMRLEDQIRTVS